MNSIVVLLSAIRMCPAVMFAQSRTDSVMGRINRLIDSIITIKCERAIGVDRGTKCLTKCVVFFIMLNITTLSHRGRAKLSVKSICLVSVYT